MPASGSISFHSQLGYSLSGRATGCGLFCRYPRPFRTVPGGAADLERGAVGVVTGVGLWSSDVSLVLADASEMGLRSVTAPSQEVYR